MAEVQNKKQQMLSPKWDIDIALTPPKTQGWIIVEEVMGGL